MRNKNRLEKMVYSSSGAEKARSVGSVLEERYGIKKIDRYADIEASLILALGGDGFMLDTLRRRMGNNIPVYGINCGNVGFLLNEFHSDQLLADIESAEEYNLNILKAELSNENGTISGTAINDFYILRNHGKASKLRISVDDELLIENFVGDGVIVSTAVGSTAYNAAAGGPILALDSNCITLTTINAFIPKQCRSIVLLDSSIIEIDVLYPDRRPVMAALDAQVFTNIKKARISIDRKNSVIALFRKDNSLRKKILKAQFQQ
ncbi:NAD kinase [Neorickettsia helminthoeca]|nr:NAD kinase [Neorickettsia helminthoeca]